ncbi:MAG: type II toxin-antitoxin system VapC family toxin [Acidimicrobiales bacterium]
MTALLVDTSVVLKWFHDEGESEVRESRAILDAHTRGEVRLHVIDFALYELGNVLLRGLGWSGPDVAGQLDDLVRLLGVPLAMTEEWNRRAALLGAEKGLTFYDAAWAAAGAALGVPLVTGDRSLLAARLGESPTSVVQRLLLP